MRLVGRDHSLCRGGEAGRAPQGQLCCLPALQTAAQVEASAAQHPGKGFNNVLKIKPKRRALASSCAASEPHDLSVMNMEFSLPLALSGNPGALQASSCTHSFTL